MSDSLPSLEIHLSCFISFAIGNRLRPLLPFFFPISNVWDLHARQFQTNCSLLFGTRLYSTTRVVPSHHQVIPGYYTHKKKKNTLARTSSRSPLLSSHSLNVLLLTETVKTCWCRITNGYCYYNVAPHLDSPVMSAV